MTSRSDSGSWFPSASDVAVFLGYVVCAAVYVVVGVAYTDFLLSFWVALVYLVFTAWAVPQLFRRWRRR